MPLETYPMIQNEVCEMFKPCQSLLMTSCPLPTTLAVALLPQIMTMETIKLPDGLCQDIDSGKSHALRKNAPEFLQKSV